MSDEKPNYLIVTHGSDQTEQGGYAYATMYEGASDGVSLKLPLTEDLCAQYIEKFAAALGFLRSLKYRQKLKAKTSVLSPPADE